MLRSLVLLAAALPVPAASAETVAIFAGKDNTLFSTDGATSNGAGGAVFSGRTNGAGTRQRALLWFDIAKALPAGATVTSASLTLTLVQAAPNSGTQVHTLHVVGASWGEGTSNSESGMGAAATPDDATWLHRFWPDVFWKSAGGDFDSAPHASATVGTGLRPYVWESALLAADVQAWLDDPSCNFGWLLLGNEGVLGTSKKFASREPAKIEQQPVLTVTFTAPCAGDLDDSGAVALEDVLALLTAWGPCAACPADIDGNGVVNVLDLVALLSAWGEC